MYSLPHCAPPRLRDALFELAGYVIGLLATWAALWVLGS
jgi:hypothetical protein